MSVSIAEVVRDLFPNDARTRQVVLQYLATGKPVPVRGMVCNPEYSPNELDPIGAWSMHAEPSIGWQPTMDAMRRIILALAEGGA